MVKKLSDEPVLQFREFVFRTGVNVTVRRGCKWSGFKGEVVLASTGEPQEIRRGEIHSTIAYKFEDIPHKLVAGYHSAGVSSRARLYSILAAMYSDFDDLEIVTVIIFKVLGN